MLNLEKGQTITKTAEETAVALDGEMNMDAKLIGKFITQQVAVGMAENSREYDKKIKKLEKGGKDNVKGESTQKNGTRGGGRASKKIKPSKTQPTTKSGPHQNLRLGQHHADIVSFEALCKENPKTQAMLTAERQKKEKNKSRALQERIEADIADLENRRRQIARSVQEQVKDSYGFLPDERRSAKHNALVILTTME